MTTNNTELLKDLEQFGAGAKALTKDVITTNHDTFIRMLVKDGVIKTATPYQVKVHHKKIDNWIKNRYNNVNSLKTRYSNLVYWLKLAKAPKKLLDHYSDIATDFNKKYLE
eukprot:Lithocolla_globosa_v1_NODE_113_length_6217_cov_73.628043.p6 type:complete len:111 gc:universal NODE_113_length_6217_cov_73.628043:5625-5957(+)